MKEKAVKIGKCLKNNIVSKFIRKYAKIFWLILIILFGIIIISLFLPGFKNPDGSFIWPNIGVLGAGISFVTALFFNTFQLEKSNNDSSNNIQIKRAEFTKQFIREFQKNMPALYFCAHICQDYNKYDSKAHKNCCDKGDGKSCDKSNDKGSDGLTGKVTKLYEKLLERDTFDFSITDYKKLKNDLGICDDEITKVRKKYLEDVEHIIKLSKEHYEAHKLDGYCIFHKAYEQYIEELKEIKEDKKDVHNKDKRIHELKQNYAASIFYNMQNVVNNLECSSLSVQFDLLAYDKITDLVYAPLHIYMSAMYIRMMENMIRSADKNIVIYSNIKKFCSEVVRVKKQFDKEMDEERRNSEKRKEKLMAVVVKKLKQ